MVILFSFTFKCPAIHKYASRRVTIGGGGGGLPCPFSKIEKNYPNLEKECPDFGHLWVKFLIYNAIFKSFQAKKLDIFSLRGFFFLCCKEMFIKMP